MKFKAGGRGKKENSEAGVGGRGRRLSAQPGTGQREAGTDRETSPSSAMNPLLAPAMQHPAGGPSGAGTGRRAPRRGGCTRAGVLGVSSSHPRKQKHCVWLLIEFSDSPALGLPFFFLLGSAFYTFILFITSCIRIFTYLYNVRLPA